ncbi:MAG: DUF222 domain-containing protein, partial [Frankiales bacterium]
MTRQLDASAFWLTVGDPGPFPEPADEPGCSGLCACCLVDEGAVAEPVDWALPGVARPAPAPSPVLGDLERSLDALATHGPVSGNRQDTLTLLRLAERARGLALRELAEMDATGGHLRPGVQSTTATWLRDARHVTDTAARATVSLATTLRDDLPVVGDLLMGGAITLEHASSVVTGVRGLDRDVVRAAQDGLGALAQVTDPVDLRKR